MAGKIDHGRVQQDPRFLFLERDQQNTFLRTQLHARIERNTLLEARLLSTLDALDELQAVAALDLQRAHRENERLTRKLEISRMAARAAETEKEDMRAAVLQLITKVESCSDYSKWHTARLELSHRLSLHPQRNAKPLLGHPQSGPDSDLRSGECACPHAYTPAIVTELVDALAREQRSCNHTVAEAESRITVLQARVAARDVEIARRAVACRCLPAPGVYPTHLDILSGEERTYTAVHISARNRMLETDIIVLEEEASKTIFESRSEQSVQTEPTGSNTPPVFPSAYLSSRTSSRSVGPHLATGEARDINAGDLGDVCEKLGEKDTMPAALSALDAQISQLRKGLTELLAEKEDLHLLLQGQLARRNIGQGDQHVPFLVPSNEERDERAREAGVVHKEDEVEGEEFKEILLVEEECIRLMYSEDALRAELNHARGRLAALNDENIHLKERLSLTQRMLSEDPGRNSLRQDTGGRTSLNLLTTWDRWRPSAFGPGDIPLHSPGLVPLSRPLPSGSSAIDVAFPPLQPVPLPPLSTIPVDQHPPPDFFLNNPLSTDSTLSSSSSSGLRTPTSLEDPSTIPLPETPPFDEAENEAEGDDATASAGSRDMLSESESVLRFPNSRDADAVAHELAVARADADAREREISEVRDALASLQLHGTRLQSVEGVWSAALGEDGAASANVDPDSHRDTDAGTDEVRDALGRT
ncbi:hypothetical protein M0805_004448 [Coniferiporia weirii]|nr:hypothetical protein M0805_004448 [Coniferiporia weirii]